MPSLYGSSAQGQGLYGNEEDKFLSSRNQAQAQQIGLPEATGGEHGAAGSQIEANDPFANFEDIFNLNRGYAQKTANAAVDKVTGTAAAPEATPSDFSSEFQKPAAPEAPTQRPGHKPGAVPNTPAAEIAQQPTLAGMQTVADRQQGDLLGTYGQPEPEPLVVSQYSGGNAGTTQVTPTQQEPGVEYQQAEEGTKTAPTGPAPVQTAPPSSDANGDGVISAEEAFNAPTAASQGTNYTPNQAPDPNDWNLDGYVSAEEQAQADAKAPKPVAPGAAPVDTSAQDAAAKAARDAAAGINPNATDEEKAKLDRLTKTNDLLTGWADDMGQGVLQDIYGPEASMWDAAIMSTGGGRDALTNLQASYGGKDKEYRDKLVGDITQRRKEKEAAERQAGLFQGKSDEMKNAPKPTEDTGPGTWAPEGYTSGMDFLTKEGTEDQLHEAGTSISPLDAILREIPGGTKGPTDYGNEYFSGTYNTAGAPTGELRAGLGKVYNGWGSAAVEYWFKHLTPDMWKTYLSMNRATAAQQIEDWLKSTGGSPPKTAGGQWTPPPGGK